MRSARLPKPSVRPSASERELADILACAVMSGPAAVVISDAEGTIEYVNRKFTELTGYSSSEAVGQKASLLKSGLMPEENYRALWRRLLRAKDWRGEFHNRKKNGDCYWEQASITPIFDHAGKLRHCLKIAEDITEHKRLEEKLRASLEKTRTHELHLKQTCRQLASTTRALEKSQRTLQALSQQDALTGLLNRRGFETELGRVKALAERQGHSIGLLIIDIDHFKRVNDRYGHVAGDQILKACASLFRTHLRASDLVCRYGGDEIIIALPSVTAETTRQMADRILGAVRRHRFSFRRAMIPISVSIGAACGIPMPGQSLNDVMRRTDQALYCVKRNGRNGAAFSGVRDDAPPASSGTEIGHQPCCPIFATALALIEARDPATAAHCRRVAQMATRLAQALHLPPLQIRHLTQSALLHDIGKIAVPDTVLLKPGPLTSEERTLVERHAQTGYNILRSIPELEAFSETVLAHHERLDGSGYPRGLKGRKLGLDARILAVADTYDAIRAGRPYAAARSAKMALAELKRLRGSLFDSKVVNAAARCQDDLEAILSDTAQAAADETR